MVRALHATPAQERVPVDEGATGSIPVAPIERQYFTKCPDCKKVLFCYVDSPTGGVTEDWLTKNQRKFSKEDHAAVAAGKRLLN
jgi:hypothetical protein